MTIYVNALFEPLLEGATDRQKLWLAFWSHIYTQANCQDFLNLHPRDYQFMLGLDEAAYDMNALGVWGEEDANPTARRHLGDQIAQEFQWRLENRYNILWRSRSLANKHKLGHKNRAFEPNTPTVITDTRAINTWCYLLGRLKAGNLVTGFKWRETGQWTIDDLQLDAMGSKSRTYNKQ